MQKSAVYMSMALTLLFIASRPVKSETIIDGGSVSGTWTKAGSPYRIRGDIRVSGLLTIEPGVTIDFQGYYKMDINWAAMHAIGTETEPILFTRSDTNGYTNISDTSGAWHGLDFSYTTANDSTFMAYCIVEFVKNLPSAIMNNWGGAITVERYSKIIIENCEVRNNIGNTGGAIFCLFDGVPMIRNNYIHHNEALMDADAGSGGGIYCSENSAVIINNVFEYNTGDVGGAVCTFAGHPYIAGNTFRYNTAKRRGALAVITSFWECRIEKNLICNNISLDSQCGGLYVSSVPARIYNNLICNNSGTAMSLHSCDALLVNNTIANNSSIQGGGIYSSFGSSDIINTILYGNEAASGDQIYNTTGAVLTIHDCILEGGLGAIVNDAVIDTFQNVFDLDPQFLTPTADTGHGFDALAGDWQVSDRSCAINRGFPGYAGFGLPDTDLDSNRRVIHGQIDIGAYEKHIDAIDVSGLITSDTIWIADTINVLSDITVNDGIKLTIAPGSVLKFAGKYHIDVQGTLIADGKPGEYIVFTAGDTTGYPETGDLQGGWAGIVFDNYSQQMNNNDSSVLSWCIIEYGRSDGILKILNFNKIRLDNLIVRYNVCKDRYQWGGLKLQSVELLIRDCEFYENHLGVGRGCIEIWKSKVHSLRNEFFKNSAVSSTAYSVTMNSHLISQRDRFFNNHSDDRGIITVQSSQVDLANTLICNNSAGMSIIDCTGGIVNLMHSTVANNHTEMYGALRLEGAEAEVTNSIIWGNENDLYEGVQVYLFTDNTEPDFYNSIVEGGKAMFKTMGGDIYTGTYLDCIDSLPGFVMPTSGAGEGYNAFSADWSLLEISPAIEAGLTSQQVLDQAGEVDFDGNPRLNGSFLDIGAIENQSTYNQILKQPQGRFLCIGDNISLKVSVRDTAYYQWFKDEIPIIGQTSSEYRIDSVTLADQGYYLCRISNGYGTLETIPVYIIVSRKPDILIGPTDQWVLCDQTTTLRVDVSGSDPLSYQWMKDGEPLPGAVLPEYRFTPLDSSYEGTYSCIVSNTCGADTSPPARLYLAPQLCMVTVSETTGDNLVVWEKKTKAPIMAYNIYRESVAAGIYDKLATIPYDELSIYVDSTADPTQQAYLYKITAVDTAENETDIDLSKPHKTIHLLVSTNPELNTTQLEWDNYYGFDYQTYKIYRSNTGTDFDEVYSLSSSLNSWTDTEVLTGDLYYRIAVERPEPCYPSGGAGKAGAGPYHHALSNLDDNRLQAGQLPPDTLTLNNNSIYEENAPGAFIGRFLTQDPDTMDSHTYNLIPGDGDDDNYSFTLAGDLLLAAEVFDYETRNQYSIRVRTTDMTGNYYENVFAVQVLDVDESTGLPVHHAGAVKISPNPFTRSTTITFPNPGNDRYDLKVMDLSGKVILTMNNIRSSSFILYAGELEKGYYLVEISGEHTYHGKLVVK